MARNGRRRKNPSSRRNIPGKAGWPDVAIHLIDAFMESLNKGTAFTFMIFVGLLGIIAQTFLMTPDGIDSFWIRVIELGSSKYAFVGILGLTNYLWWIITKNKSKIKQAEIDRLCEIRRKLLLGEELTFLESHIESDSDINNQTMIFPEPKNNRRTD